MLGSTRNTGIKAKVFAWISINASAVSGSSTGGFAYTNANRGRAVKPERIMANELEAFGAVFAARSADESERCFVDGANRSTVFIKIGMGRAGVTRIERNTHSVKMKIVA